MTINTLIVNDVTEIPQIKPWPKMLYPNIEQNTAKEKIIWVKLPTQLDLWNKYLESVSLFSNAFRFIQALVLWLLWTEISLWPEQYAQSLSLLGYRPSAVHF